MNQTSATLPKLLEVAGTRDLISTREAALALNKARQTLLKNFCIQGHSYGIVPKKIGGQLLWSVSDIAKLLNGGV
ncbi:hypothetical protein [Polynucleobacter sp. Fuers-14]|uniref:hypothetical protein n=1 Tax=Polynucleobacter sp. Fuers-14 TaxID=1758364 RepID=UPI001C0CC394|nr:hypothetical protein [Polynucleobacter sp. Fuers-14]MBU3640826.1 hypothetical protein [Polynucleobacter sp. Fuers-14]